MEIGSMVLVIDVGNYKSAHAEPPPFRAEIFDITDYPCYWVRSVVTGNEYELYEFQLFQHSVN